MKRAVPARGAACTARADLFRLLTGYQLSQSICVVAALGIADLLRDGPLSAVCLAKATRTDADALYRLMRALAAAGVFDEGKNAMFSLAPMGELLRDDAVGSHAPMARLFGSSENWRAWGALLHSIRSGETAFDHVHGCSVWQHRKIDVEATSIFDRAMSAGTNSYARAVLDVYDFGGFSHVVDVGGGEGTFLARILAAHPHLRGTLFDQPHVVANRPIPLQDPGLSGRWTAVAGDFFKAVPEAADVYLLKWILHDWDDMACITILRVIREAMTPTSRLLVIEHVIGPPNAEPEGKFLDLMMLVMTGGRERTREEFGALRCAGGLRLSAVTSTRAALSIIEAVPQ